MYKVLMTVASLLLLSGCGGGSSTATSTTASVAGLKIGYLVDAPLEGVSYSCGSITGVTTATGEFQCSSAPVTFSIGSWVIGTLNTFTVDSVVYPQDLVGVSRNDYNNSNLVELTRILQSLDDDGNITDRITIAPTATTLFDQNSTTTTYADVQQILIAANVTLVDANASITHLRDTINRTDNVAPVVTVPSNISVVATSNAGIDANDSQIVTFLTAASATDNVALQGSVSNNAPSIFPIGDTLVTFTASDVAGNSGIATATVTVTALSIDTIAPVVTPPANLNIVATSASGIDATDAQIVAFLAGATATDNVAVIGNVTNNAPSIFPVGDTIVVFTAVDAASNSGTATATVTVTAPSVVVTDTTAPVVTAPANISVVGTSASGIDATDAQIVAFLSGAGAIDNVDGVISVSNDAPTFFPVGITQVTFTATDAASNSGSAIATVTVTAPPLTTTKTPFAPQAVTFPSVIPTVGVDVRSQIATLKVGLETQLRMIVDDVNVSYTLDVASPIYLDGAQRYSISLVSGSISKIISVDIGADGVGNTADDFIAGYTLMKDGWTIAYTGSGVDGIWFTADDVLNNGIQATSSSARPQITYTNASGYQITFTSDYSAGNDKLLFTADDSVTAYVVSKVGTSGSTGAATTFFGPGADGVWFTSDDAIREHSVSSVDANGNTFQTITYNNAGTDALWYTADDSVLVYSSAFLSASNKIDALALYDTGANGVAFDADDVLINQTFFRYDSNGYQDIVASYLSKGADNVWFTADDTATALSYAHTASGIVTEETIHSAIGADLQWLTGDDVITDRKLFTNDGQLDRRYFSGGAGPDGLWYTADDVFYQYTIVYNQVKDANGNLISSTTSRNYGDSRYDAQNRLISYVSVAIAEYGADGIARTEDDVITNAFTRIFDAQGRVTDQIRLSNIGPDHIWFTSDDVYRDYIKRTYGTAGRIERAATSSTSGVDGVWGTSDDTLSALEAGQTDAQGRVIERAGLSAGADGVFETADDQILYLNVYIYDDVNNTRTNVKYSSAGADGLWRTADDIVESTGYYVETFDTNGNVILLSYYNQAGADGLWLTSDDVLQYYSKQRYDSNGYLDRTINIFDPGADGVFGTADDGAATRGYDVDVFDASGTLLQRTFYLGKGADGILGTTDDVVNSVRLYYIPSQFGI